MKTRLQQQEVLQRDLEKALQEELACLGAEMPCLKEISACLDKIDALPLAQRLAFLEKGTVERAFEHPRSLEDGHVPHKTIGRRLLRTLSVLWMPYEKDQGALQAEQDLKQHCTHEADEKHSGPLDADRTPVFLRGLSSLLDWGCAEEAWEALEKYIMPQLGIKAPLEEDAGKFIEFLGLFIRHGAWSTLHTHLTGTLDVSHPMWGNFPTFLSLHLVEAPPQEREAFRLLLHPRCRSTHLHALSGAAQQHLHGCIVSVHAACVRRDNAGNNIRKATLHLYETFPWLLDVTGQVFSRTLGKERHEGEGVYLVTSPPAYYYLPAPFSSIKMKEEQRTLYGSCCRFLPTQDWQAWGVLQPQAHREALVWMAAGQRPPQEAGAWMAWAQEQSLPATWWQGHEGRPGLLSFLTHTGLPSHFFTQEAQERAHLHHFALTYTGVRILFLKTWADALKATFPRYLATLQQETGEALESFLIGGVAHQVFGLSGKQGKKMGDIFLLEEQEALFALGELAGTTWWEKPFALTYDEALMRKIWTERAFDTAVGLGNPSLRLEKEDFRWARGPLDEHTPSAQRPRLSLIGAAMPCLQRLYDKKRLTDSLAPVVQRDGQEQKKRARL